MNEYQGVRTATSDEVERLSLPDGVEVAVSDRRSRCVQRAAGADRGRPPTCCVFSSSRTVSASWRETPTSWSIGAPSGNQRWRGRPLTKAVVHDQVQVVDPDEALARFERGKDAR